MHTSGITGPNNATLNLLEAINRKKFLIDVASPASGDMVQRLAGMGIRHIPLDFAQGKELSTILRLVSLIRENRYLVLHGHMGRVAPCISVAGKICGVPAVLLTEHMSDPEHSWLKGKPVRRFFHFFGHGVTNNCLDAVIAVSEDAGKNYILRQKIDPQKVAIIPNSVNFDAVRANENEKGPIKKEFGFSESAVVIGMAGRLIPEKGHRDVLAAIPGLLKTDANIRVVILGAGPARPELESFVKESGLRDVVKFLGFRNDVYRLLKGIDIFIQPSWTESHESFGLALIEAMSCSIPVVASNINPFREIIAEGKTGLFFQEKDSADLAVKVRKLLENREFARAMGLAGSLAVEKSFNPPAVARLTEQTYERLLIEKGYRLC
jgi:glycosyltransferase involved in cell wall biosynthesis